MTIYEDIFHKYGLSLSQQEILKIVGLRKTVLEIGPSSGYMTGAFLENFCTVDVVEKDKKAIIKIPQGVRNIIEGSAEDKDTLKQLLSDYDFIIMADVLEHLVDPEKFLKYITKIASSNTKLIISVPNIASWVMRKQLFFKGDFQYQDSGLLDRTHLHFYTVNSLPKMFDKAGWNVEEITGTITRLPFEGVISKMPIIASFFKSFIYSKLVKRFKNLSYYHFVVVASKK